MASDSVGKRHPEVDLTFTAAELGLILEWARLSRPPGVPRPAWEGELAERIRRVRDYLIQGTEIASGWRLTMHDAPRPPRRRVNPWNVAALISWTVGCLALGSVLL